MTFDLDPTAPVRADDAAMFPEQPRLWSLGSGSKGNAMVLAHAGHHLMFDAGYELPALVERLRAAGLHPWDIDDVVLSHGHRDHVVGAATGAQVYGWRVWGALEAAGYDGALYAAPQDTVLGPLDVAPLGVTGAVAGAAVGAGGSIAAARGMTGVA